MGGGEPPMRKARSFSVAIAALLIWMCTAAVGAYLLTSRARPADDDVEAGPAHAHAPQPEPVAAPGAAAPAPPRRAKDRFDPPSLVRAKSEPIPGGRALAEFAHPALAIIGLAFWILYVLSRDRVFAAIGLGIVLGAICAGLSWFTVNHRDVRKGQRGALALSPRLLILHGTGAALTLLFAALIVARV
jgi:hypothetical protein